MLPNRAVVGSDFEVGLSSDGSISASSSPDLSSRLRRTPVRCPRFTVAVLALLLVAGAVMSTNPTLATSSNSAISEADDNPPVQQPLSTPSMVAAKRETWVFTVEAALDVDGDVEVVRHDLRVRPTRVGTFPRFLSDGCSGSFHRRRGAILFGRVACTKNGSSTTLGEGAATRTSEPFAAHKKGSVLCVSNSGGTTDFAILTSEQERPAPSSAPILDGGRPCAMLESGSWSELDAIISLLGDSKETIEPALQISVRSAG